MTVFDYNDKEGIGDATAVKWEKRIYENKHNHDREMSKKIFLKTATAVVAGTLAVGVLSGGRNKPVFYKIGLQP